MPRLSPQPYIARKRALEGRLLAALGLAAGRRRVDADGRKCLGISSLLTMFQVSGLGWRASELFGFSWTVGVHAWFMLIGAVVVVVVVAAVAVVVPFLSQGIWTRGHVL